MKDNVFYQFIDQSLNFNMFFCLLLKTLKLFIFEGFWGFGGWGVIRIYILLIDRPMGMRKLV